MNWQDFSTAPTDGTAFLSYRYGVFGISMYEGDFEERRKSNQRHRWTTGDGLEITRYLPTHWMPLPDAPGEDRQSTDSARIDALESVARDALVDLVDYYSRAWHLCTWSYGRALMVWNRMKNGLPNVPDNQFHPELNRMRYLSELTNGWVRARQDLDGNVIGGEWVPMDAWQKELAELQAK